MRLVLIVALLAGCNSMPADPAKMGADQIREWVKDKSAAVTCISTKNAVGNVTAIVANLDKGAVHTGTVTVNADCVTMIQSDPKKVSVP